MLARRVIALSPDKAFAKQLGTALKAAGGAVELHTSIGALGRGDLQATLVVAHLEGEVADSLGELATRVGADGRVIAILPRSDLERAIAVMQTSDRIAGVLVADPWRPVDLASMAMRVLAGDIFGLEKLVPWGTKIHSQLVGDYQEKALCIAQLSEFAELMGVRRKYREAIEQVVDEMLMNALYDAPVDEHGKQVFAEIPTKTRISLRMEQKVVVQYACDEKTFSVSVRDSYGTLERETVLRYIDKCLHSDQQIDRKTGGAGLGLYLMANSTSRMFFNVLPGVATEAVATFDLDAPKVQLNKLAFFYERIDAAGRLAAGPSRLLPAGVSHPVERRSRARSEPSAAAARTPTAVVAALSGAIVLLLVLIALVAYPRLEATPEGTITVVTSPGALVEVPGEVRMTAPDDGRLTIRNLEVGKSYTVVAQLPGHAAARTQVLVREDAAVPVELVLVRETASVTIDTDPQGATVIVENGGELGTTPLTTERFEPGSEVAVVLRKSGYADKKVTLKIPDAGGAMVVDRQLAVSPDAATIVVTSEPPGADVVVDGQRQVGVQTPTGELLVEAAKRHTVRVELPGHAAATVTVTPGRGARAVPVAAKLVPAVDLTVDAGIEARFSVEGVPACEKVEAPGPCALPKGSYKVKVEATKAVGRFSRDVKIADKPVKLELDLGVLVAPDGMKLMIGGREVERAAFEGTRAGKKVTVTLLDGDGVMIPAEAKVVAGKETKLKR